LQKNQDHSDRNTFPTRIGAYGSPRRPETTVGVRLDEARVEKMLAEHNPFSGVS
jgi:hypothetical protein